MVEVAQSIDLKLSKKLKDRNYRKKFFLAEASARIAKQLIALRNKRNLSQTDLANELGTRQPAISRVESADYQNWSFTTLRRIADVLDARIRVTIEPAEDVLGEYEDPKQLSAEIAAAAASSGTEAKFSLSTEDFAADAIRELVDCVSEMTKEARVPLRGVRAGAVVLSKLGLAPAGGTVGKVPVALYPDFDTIEFVFRPRSAN